MCNDARKLESSVAPAAEVVLKHKGFVSAIDLLLEMRRLQPSDVENWRRGRVPCLERLVQVNLSKIGRILRTFRQWALAKGLKASETRYVRQTRGGKPELRFSVSGDPNIERAYRTRYVPRGAGSSQTPETRGAAPVAAGRRHAGPAGVSLCRAG